MRVKTLFLILVLFTGMQIQSVTQALAFKKDQKIGFKVEIEDLSPNEYRTYWRTRLDNDQKIIEQLEAIQKQMEKSNEMILAFQEAQEETAEKEEQSPKNLDTTSLEKVLLENNKAMAKIYRVIEEQTTQQRRFNETFIRALGAAK